MIIYSFVYANVRWASLLMCTNNTIQCPYFHNDRLSIVRLLIYDMQVSNTGLGGNTGTGSSGMGWYTL